MSTVPREYDSRPLEEIVAYQYERIKCLQAEVRACRSWSMSLLARMKGSPREPELMSTQTLYELSHISTSAVNELRAWLCNKLQILSGSNDMESRDLRVKQVIQANARRRKRCAELMLEEFDDIIRSNSIMTNP